MLHERLLELIARHVAILDEARRRGIEWSDVLSLYAVLHALQVHAQAVIDYLLHTCAALGETVETPVRCVSRLRDRGLLGGEEAEMFKRLIRFRNIVVHEYASIDVERVKSIVEGEGYRKALEAIHRLHRVLAGMGVLDP